MDDVYYNEDSISCALQAANRTDVSENPWIYISCLFGPQTQGLPVTIMVTVINAIIFVTGLLGNIAVCVVIIKQPMLHTATNYYLFNLAVSDVTLLVFGLPNDVAMYWHQYPWPMGDSFCKIRALISEMASYVSVLTVVAFSTERYIAICYPLHLRAMSGLQRAVWIIAGLWAVSFLSALPFAIHTAVHYLNYPLNSTNIIKESAMCAMMSQPTNIPLAEISSIVFFIIPMIVIVVQYTNMGISISKTTQTTLGKKLKGSVHRTNKKIQSNKSVIRMLSFVVLGFFVCWAPFHTQRIVSIYFSDNEYFDEVNYWMFCITGMFYYFSSTLNPILYNVMSDRMRNAFREVFCGIKPKKKGSRRMSTMRDTSDTYVSPKKSDCFFEEADEHEALMTKKDETLILFTDRVFNKNRSIYVTKSIENNKRHSNEPVVNGKSHETCI